MVERLSPEILDFHAREARALRAAARTAALQGAGRAILRLLFQHPARAALPVADGRVVRFPPRGAQPASAPSRAPPPRSRARAAW